MQNDVERVEVAAHFLGECIEKDTVLVKFGNGTYVGPTGATWLQADVIKYLKKNFVACADDVCA